VLILCEVFGFLVKECVEMLECFFELVFDNSCLWVVFGNFGFLECFD